METKSCPLNGTKSLKRFVFGILSSSALLSAFNISAAEQPCDADWTWNAVGRPQGITPVGEITDFGGTVYANASGEIVAWNGFSWGSALATFAKGGVKAMTTCAYSYSPYIYIGGTFEGLYDGNNNLVAATNVARYDIVNNIWTPIGTGTPLECDNNVCTHTEVESMVVDSLGNIYVGLDRAAPEVSAGHREMLMKWDPSSQSWLPVGGGLEVDDQDDSTACPSIVPEIATPRGVTALAVDGTDIYVAGFFKSCGTVSTYHLAKWNGVSQTWTALAPDRHWCFFRITGDVPDIYSILFASNRLYVAGKIGPACNATYPIGLAEFSTSGAGIISNEGDNLWHGPFSDGTYDPGTGNALCVRACMVYLTGQFESIGVTGSSGTQASNIVEKIMGTGTWAPMGTGLSSVGTHLAAHELTDTNHVFVTGGFDTAGGITSQSAAFWGPPPNN